MFVLQSSATEKAVITPLKIRRTVRAEPKCTSTQSDHDYCLVNQQSPIIIIGDAEHDIVDEQVL